MKQKTFLFISSLALVLTTLSSNAQSSDTRILKISGYRNYLPDNHPIPVSIRKFGEILATKSNGKLVLEHVMPTTPSPNSQINNIRDKNFDTSTPEIMVASVTGLADLVEEFTLLDVPFIARNDSEIDNLLDGELGSALFNKLESTGIIGLAYWENGFRQITSSKAPIVQAEDFIDLKMRVIPRYVFVLPFE